MTARAQEDVEPEREAGFANTAGSSRQRCAACAMSSGGDVSWDKSLCIGATYDITDSCITHQIVDRPGQQTPVIGRYYVQPQWVFDAVNARLLLPVADYFPGEQLSPYLSPFVSEKEGNYVPPEKLKLLVLQRGQHPEDLNESEEEEEGKDNNGDEEGENEEEEEDDVEAGSGKEEEAWLTALEEQRMEEKKPRVMAGTVKRRTEKERGKEEGARSKEKRGEGKEERKVKEKRKDGNQDGRGKKRRGKGKVSKDRTCDRRGG
ncbi:Pescadillo like protein [Pteropus alecto]|uniref:Pescadillo like protein n=1 Tax=Pteropus alecto TaxID=9402 RepID=L5KZD0_PTEAL|nr:Pescadillo like protein [Pteropus alecto]